MEALTPLLQDLQGAWLPTALRLSDTAYPLVNAAHIIGIALLFGAIVPLDLRLLGFWRSAPLSALARVLLPVAMTGLALALATGALLFSVDAVKYAGMGVFQLKLALILLAGANALALRGSTWGDRYDGARDAIPARLKLAGLVSMLLWVSVILSGRMIAYFA